LVGSGTERAIGGIAFAADGLTAVFSFFQRGGMLHTTIRLLILAGLSLAGPVAFPSVAPPLLTLPRAS